MYRTSRGRRPRGAPRRRGGVVRLRVRVLRPLHFRVEDLAASQNEEVGLPVKVVWKMINEIRIISPDKKQPLKTTYVRLAGTEFRCGPSSQCPGLARRGQRP